MPVTIPQLAPAAVRVLFDLAAASQTLDFSKLAQRSGLDINTTNAVLRSLQQIGAVRALAGVPGLQRPLWQITETGVEIVYAIEMAAAKQIEDTQQFDAGRFVAAQHGHSPHGQAPAAQPPSAVVDAFTADTEFVTVPGLPETSIADSANTPVGDAGPMLYTKLTPTQSRRARKGQQKRSQGNFALRGGFTLAGITSIFGNRRRVVVSLLILSVVVTGLFALAGVRAVNFTITGVEHNAVLSPSNLFDNRLNFAVEGGSTDDVQLRLDGLPVSGLQRSANNFSWTVPSLTDGFHTVSLDVPRRLFGTATASISFTVDSIPPDLGLPAVHEPVPLSEPFVLTSQIDPGTDLLIDGVPVDTSDGTFTIARDLPPAGPISFLAVDEAGNATALDMVVPIAYPATTGVHVTAAAWDHDGLRSGIIDLIQANQISAVQLDLKDERGFIGYASSIPLAIESESTQNLFELKDAIDELHSLGVRVIGRIVAFLDPALGRYAVRTGNTDWVLQNTAGNPLPTTYGTGAFTNFSNSEVRQYNLDIAVEAAEAGIDDVLWDYMRRPEGDFSKMVVPGFDSVDASPLIVSFLAEAGEMLRNHQVYHGVSVFGISARRGDLIAQDVVAISDHVDYVSPMVYPSHWGRGEYGVAHPEAQPYDIIEASLRDFQQVLAGTNTEIVPWLQDFSISVSYGANEVRAQIDAASDIGISNWLLWDPTVTYTQGAIPVN